MRVSNPVELDRISQALAEAIAGGALGRAAEFIAAQRGINARQEDPC